MVDSRFLVTVSRSFRSPGPAMALSGSQSPLQPPRNRKDPGNLNPVKPASCHRSFTAAADAAVLLAVLLAFGFLLLPCLQLFCRELTSAGVALISELKEEHPGAPTTFLLVCLAFFLLTLAVFLPGAGGRKCGNANCRRLRDAAKLDVRIETEECAKTSGFPDGGDGAKRLFFRLSEGRHRQLEAELKKMTPPNGRAVLLFREKCGCAVGRMVVHGPKKARRAKR